MNSQMENGGFYRKETLQNGLRVIAAPMPHTRSVSIGFYVGVGSRYELEAQAGISHFIEHMLFKGTDRRRTPSEISSEIEGVGGMLNAGTDKEMTVYWCKVAQPHFLRALDVLADMLMNSRLDATDVERERQVIVEEILMTKDSPAQEVSLIIDELLWPDHPLGRDTAGTRESVMAMDSDMLRQYMDVKYLPTNTVVAVAGGVEYAAALEAVNQAFAMWSNRKPVPGYEPYADIKNPRLRIKRRETEQSHLCLALPGVSLLDPRRFAIDVLNIVLGEGMSSRLFTEIRENLGLAYSIYSYTDHFLDSGALTVSAGVEPGNLRKTIEATLEQLARLKTETIPDAELAKAKELSKGRILLRMEDSRNVNGWIGGQEVLTGKIMSVDDIIAAVEAVTADEIKQLADELLIGDKLRLAVVGPISKEERLEELLKL